MNAHHRVRDESAEPILAQVKRAAQTLEAESATLYRLLVEVRIEIAKRKATDEPAG